MTEGTTTNNTAIACNMTAIEAAHREQHGITVRALFAAVQDIRALPGGYAFKLPEAMVIKAAEFIANERLCCPFFEFALDVAPNRGPIWLRLTGSEEAKQLISVEFSTLLDPRLAHQLDALK